MRSVALVHVHPMSRSQNSHCLSDWNGVGVSAQGEGKRWEWKCGGDGFNPLLRVLLSEKQRWAGAMPGVFGVSGVALGTSPRVSVASASLGWNG
jgi:hypothetical protein